jgi:hypothetical protein
MTKVGHDVASRSPCPTLEGTCDPDLVHDMLLDS